VSAGEGPPPAPPSACCDITGPTGQFHIKPTYAPAGKRRDVGGGRRHPRGPLRPSNCNGSSDLVIPGGNPPCWGPADPPATTSPTGGLKLVLSAKGAKLGNALAQGYSFSVRAYKLSQAAWGRSRGDGAAAQAAADRRLRDVVSRTSE
jgi:hypothetical protein